MADCAKPSVDVSTNAGIAQGLLDYSHALNNCNTDKALLREWYREEL
jgi:hypothetical protein